MNNHEFGLAFCTGIADRILGSCPMIECLGPGGGAFLELRNVETGGSAGFLRLWAAPAASRLDRLIHVRLQGGPVDTQLMFLFGRADLPMPHFHGQVVQFAPDACVYNADLIPRLDPVEHPGHFREVFAPLTTAYWQAVGHRANACAAAPANPAIAAYLSPWSIAAGQPTTRAELQSVGPSITAYVDHCLALARDLGYRGPSAAELRARDQRHLALLHSDDLDPRAWKGVYRLLGQEAGHRLKGVLQTPLQQGDWSGP